MLQGMVRENALDKARGVVMTDEYRQHDTSKNIDHIDIAKLSHVFENINGVVCRHNVPNVIPIGIAHHRNHHRWNDRRNGNHDIEQRCMEQSVKAQPKHGLHSVRKGYHKIPSPHNRFCGLFFLDEERKRHGRVVRHLCRRSG